MSNETENKQEGEGEEDEENIEWDDKKMMLKYIKFTHGCLIIDCVENELRSLAKVSDLLSFYGLYRQVMSGDNNTIQPSYIYAEKRLKWNAWTKYKGLTKQQSLIKWEKLYNKFLNLFPNIFKQYGDNVYLNKYNPLIPFINDNIKNELKLQIKNNDNDNDNDDYISLKKQQYDEIIEYVNKLKNKMQSYHNEFEKNSKQIQILKTANNKLKKANDKINKARDDNNNYKRQKYYYFIICLIFVAVITFIYNKYIKKKKDKVKVF